LKLVLSSDPRIELLATGLPIEALSDIAEQQLVRVLILDGETTLSKDIAALRSLAPDLAILVLLRDARSGSSSHSLSNGATTSLSTDAAPFAVRSAIRFAAEGKKVSVRASGAVEGPRMANVESLTPRQREVLELIALNLRRPEIALALGIKDATVASHTQEVFRKMGVSRCDELVGLELTPVAKEPIVIVPARLEALLRDALHIILGDSASEISDVTERAGRKGHPESYSEPLERFLRTCALLEASGWSDSQAPGTIEINFDEHQQVLTEALGVMYSVAEAELEEVEKVDAERVARGKAPKCDATLEQFQELFAFAVRIDELARRQA
jgi:DNA-binding NarL/FixJ family response regulator